MDQPPEGWSLEQVLTVMQQDISGIKGSMATKDDVASLNRKVDTLNGKADTLIDSQAATVKRVMALEATQHEH